MFKNVLVTGGAGFIGSHMVDELLWLEKNIIVLDALTYAGNVKNLDLNKIVFYHGDINDQELVSNILTKHSIDTVINCAAETHVDNSIDAPAIFVETNVNGTLNLLRCSLVQSQKIGNSFRYIQMSTDEVYGSLGENGCFVEKSLISPSSPYSASKAAADHLVKAWFHTYGLPVIITRCSNNYGIRQNKEKLIPKIIINILSNIKIPVYGNGKNVRDWIHVKDHCNGVVLAIMHGIPGEVYCFGGNCEISNIALINKIIYFITGIKDINAYKGYYNFVKDRLGHDFRYAINFSYATNKLGFYPKQPFDNEIKQIISWYKNYFLN